jgi:D-tagatose-1,6-bisphosphate aldolase subunit GatZ/KbaZ
MSQLALARLPKSWRQDRSIGLASLCSAHPLVIEAALTFAHGEAVVIEATCNQVNQEGGYTGMTPADFVRFVASIASGVGFDLARLVLGGDHLGPNPWKHLPAPEALRRAETMVGDYVAAGFTKIHLDASMTCGGDPATLDESTVAERAARLAAIAEVVAERTGRKPPVYVIGSEVPVPGGTSHALSEVEITQPESALAALEAHRRAFASAGVASAFARVVALVVQPGVEFDHRRVLDYEQAKAKRLSKVLDAQSNIVFEAHSTDYQSPAALAALVRDGFAILKVGPALTFAMREALYGLDHIARERNPSWAGTALEPEMERMMLADPKYWQNYYRGVPEEQRLLRHYSYSDRIRYYWPAEDAKAAVARLLATLDAQAIPEPLISQFLPQCYQAVRQGVMAPRPRQLILESIRHAFRPYLFATGADRSSTDKARKGPHESDRQEAARPR